MSALRVLNLAFLGLLEISILAVFLQGVWTFYLARLRGIPSGVRHGEKARAKFIASYSVVSVLVLQVVNSANALDNWKILISLANLAMLFHLFFFNGWFHEVVKRAWNRWESRFEEF